MTGPNRRAVTRMLRATGLVHVPEEAPLVQLLRELADEIDAGGGARPRLAYLSALKDVRRVLAYSAGRPRSSSDAPAAADLADVESAGVPPMLNDLARFKEKRGIA